MKPKKLRFTKMSSSRLPYRRGDNRWGERSWLAQPMEGLSFTVNEKPDGQFYWIGYGTGYFFRPEPTKTKERAIAACQRLWDRFVRKQLRAMLERPAPPAKRLELEEGGKGQ